MKNVSYQIVTLTEIPLAAVDDDSISSPVEEERQRKSINLRAT
jgi:hypothetical protein